jgi:hypothetical protein
MKTVELFFHHCIAHPIVGICYILGLDEFGDKLHDIVLFDQE